ncbi:MAG: sigma-70 family RNA polymerase sigma factor [Actinobacteria bacterium]|nr:sigma-70 family RNA polymerase sigma factor [Actinomycetota bacterium]
MVEDHLIDVYRTHVERIYRYCLFRMNSDQDAEDITAEVFVRFLENYDKVEQDRILAWLFTVAGNLCIDRYRKATRLGHLEEQLEVAQGHFNSPWEDEEVWQALRSLNPKQQQVIYLKIVEDMSFKDVANFLSKKEGAVKMLFYRGIKGLRRILKEGNADVLLVRETRGGEAGSSN